MAFDFRCRRYHGNGRISTNHKTKHASIKSATLASWTLFLLLTILATPTTATISFVDSGRTFVSRQDTHIGQPLLSGYEYMGRLQSIPENPTLCPGKYPNQKFDIVNPTDGLPVALVAKSGGCSIFDKVMVASSLINPANTVGYLIVQDASKRHHLSLGNYTIDSEMETQLQVFHNDVKNLLHLQDDESLLTEYLSSAEVELRLAEQNGRALLELPAPSEPGRAPDQQPLENRLYDINIALLHVSYGTGEVLVDILDSQDPLDKLKGGPRVLLNGRGGSWGANTVVFWMLVIFSACACGCACLLICVQTDDEPEPPPPRRPVRRRCTLEEVRSRFPSYHFVGEEHTQTGCCPSDGAQYTQLSDVDECTICLDEFVHGVRVRKLPCGHVFHSTCIARWLVERHANCPLCKLDLYVEPEAESDSESESSNTQPHEPQSFWNGWFVNSNAGYSPLEVPSGAAETAEGLSPSGAVQDEPRSWWPFSLETSANDEPESSRPLPRAMAAALSSFLSRTSRSLRRLRHHGEANLTELTEPLVSSSSTEEVVEPAEAPASTVEL